MLTTLLGIDLGKRWFHVVGKDAAGHVTLRRKCNRAELIEFIAQHSRCLIGMETCCGSQHFARKFSAAGHEVKLLPAQYVKPFVKSQKNDFNDALAVAEAVVLPTMRFVPIRSEEQMDVQALHRARERMLQQRLALTNQIRGLLLDGGVEIAQGFYALRTVLPQLLADDRTELTPMMRDLGRLTLEMWNRTEQAIKELNTRIARLASSSDLCRRLQSVLGVGAAAPHSDRRLRWQRFHLQARAQSAEKYDHPLSGALVVWLLAAVAALAHAAAPSDKHQQAR